VPTSPVGYLSIDPSGPGTIFNITNGSFSFGMGAGSFPSQVSVPGGGMEVGIRAALNNYFAVWSNSASGVTAFSNGIMQGFTNPSIAWLTNNQLGFGFHGDNGNLWVSTGGLTNGFDTHGAMKTITSPSIAQTPNGNVAIAFQGSNGHLWLGATPTTGVDTGNVIYSPWASSPSIAAQPGTNNVAFAFQGSNGHLWVGNTGPHSGFDTGQAMSVGHNSGPSVAVTSSGTVYVAFASSTLKLSLYTISGTSRTVTTFSQSVNNGFSQLTIQIASAGQYQIAYGGANGNLWINLNGVAEDQLYPIDCGPST
jgi:hypothetical protein